MQHETLRAMLGAMEKASNAAFPSAERGEELDEVVSPSTATFPLHTDDDHSDTDTLPFEALSFAPTTPESSAATSSYSPDGSSDYDMDEDVMVDAAVNDNGLFANALLSEEHIVLDAALLHEMDELLATNDHLHLESPSISFPLPGGPWAIGHVTSPVSSPVSHDTSVPFLPRGDGWGVVDPSHESAGGGNDAAVDDTEAEPESSDIDAPQKEMELLARQLKFLEAQREFLEYKASLAASSEDAASAALLLNRRDAIHEKRRLVEAQLHKEMLTKVAKQQLENLKYMELMLLQSPVTHYRHTLMTPMESYIHLTRDPKERRATLMALRYEKIDTARRFIEFQCRNIELERQFFYLDTFEKFGKFYTVDFSIAKFDDASVDEVVNVIYNHFVSTKDMISQILGSVENREYFDGMEWTFMNARFVDRINLPKRRRNDRGFVVQESNTVYYMKRFGDTVVMTSDCVDKDDLHPYRASGRIRKDTTVGVIVEPFVDSHGKESVLLKRFSFVRHHFKNVEPTPDLIQAISTKVILWGQAVRFCLSSRARTLPPSTISPQLMTRAAEITELATASP